MYPSEIHKTMATNQAQKHSVYILCDMQHVLHIFHRAIHDYKQNHINSDTFIDFFL